MASTLRWIADVRAGKASATPSWPSHHVRGSARQPMPSGLGRNFNVSSKFKLVAVVVPPFALSMEDRDLSSGRGFLS